MIWFLLYPLRGTTEPPRLNAKHPIRRAFVNHGTRTAKHWQLSLLVSVAVGVVLCYPAFFLYGTSSPGSHTLAHHVWTSAQVYNGPPETPADVEMRPIWIHGSFMKALKPSVFRDALEIQETIVKHGFGDDLPNPGTESAGRTASEVEIPSVSRYPCNLAPGGHNALWGFHSPLMLSNCTVAASETSEQLVNSINEELSNRQSHWNITLRPSLLFSGKTFARNRLVAADALVITLFNPLGSDISDELDSRVEKLFLKNKERWSFYPPEGKATQSQLYEFLFQPMSFHDDILLAVAYASMALYVVISLRKIRAVKSKFGLLITVIVEMAVSILASFTICGMLGINLTRIPREVHPFVVLVMGLENRFRLINAVIAYPPEMQTNDRVSQALGDVGHLSIAAACQMLLTLWFLSRVVSPDVAALCSFAVIALVFDFFFHLTFFTAVLCVDVRRMELQESLEKANVAPKAQANASLPRSRPSRQSVIDAIMNGDLPSSTRIAGSAVAIIFVLTLNLHFSNSAEHYQLLLELFRFQHRDTRQNSIDDIIRSPPINQARTPSSWLQMQEPESAKELISLMKPDSHSFIARVYEPITIVLENADRSGIIDEFPTVLDLLRKVADQHLFPFVLVVAGVISLTTLLMDFLLWGVSDEEKNARTIDEVFSVCQLPNLHRNDVGKLYSSPRGHLISIDLDKLITIWWAESNATSYSSKILNTSAQSSLMWPVVASAIDEQSGNVALCTNEGRLAFWNAVERRPSKVSANGLHGQRPLAMAFVPVQQEEAGGLNLVIATTDGNVTTINYTSGQPRTQQMYVGTAISAIITARPDSSYRVLSIYQDGAIVVSTATGLDWVSNTVKTPDQLTNGNSLLSKPRLILPVESLRLFAVVRNSTITLFDISSQRPLHIFHVNSFKPTSLRIMFGAQRLCSCQSIAVSSLSLVYSNASGDTCNVETYRISESTTQPICLGASSRRLETCKQLDSAQSLVYTVENAGSWETIHTQSVIGIGKNSRSRNCSPESESKEGYSTGRTPSAPSTARSRKSTSLFRTTRSPPRSPLESDQPPEWTVWALSGSGKFISRPLAALIPTEISGAGDVQHETLFAQTPGPITKVGKRGIAVALGNTLRIITAGSERFEETANGYKNPTASVKYRKKSTKKNL